LGGGDHKHKERWGEDPVGDSSEEGDANRTVEGGNASLLRSAEGAWKERGRNQFVTNNWEKAWLSGN